jgi:hypothetical protein
MIKTGIKHYKDGILEDIRIEQYNAIYPYKHKVIKIWGYPINNGSEEYQKIKIELGDDWVSDLTNCWFEIGFMELDKQEKIQKILSEV